MTRTATITLTLALLAFPTARAWAAETCGDGQDNDSDDMTDEGCWPQAVTGVSESRLSPGRTGYV